jgi:SAM-dependent methyltransferase
VTRPGRPSAHAHDLQALYAQRFSGKEAYRRRVWGVLFSDFFAPYVRGAAAVLDLGCGYGEFINQVDAPRCYAMDLNPDAGRHLRPHIEWLRQDCSQPWPIPDNSLDVVFSSNFFEHLPDEATLLATVSEAYRCLRPGGRLVALGPNITYVGRAYWDFEDHQLALTEASLGAVLQSAGCALERVVPRFLPYTMSDGRQYPTFLLRLYLRLPFAWRLFGSQFLVVARKNPE